MATRDELIAALLGEDDPTKRYPLDRNIGRPLGRQTGSTAAYDIGTGLAEHLKELVEKPGRAMREGITTGEAVPWATDVALGTAGVSTPFAVRGAVGAGGGKIVQPEGIRAYHGSPHDFDRFDMSRIGTGEGAQAYGHGLYFAENPTTAQSYRDTLKLSRSKLPDDVLSLPPEMRQAITTHARTDADAVTAAKRAQYMSSALRSEDVTKLSDMVNRIRDAERGRMYEVNINARPEQFLDWDKPLSGQSPHVLSALEPMGFKPRKEELRAFDDALLAALSDKGPAKLPRQPPDPQGASIYGAALRQHYPRLPSPEAAARASTDLREAGIPGIRYLDQGSRADTAGWALRQAEADALKAKGSPHWEEAQKLADSIKASQSSNYAVWDDKIIEIMRKYGLMGAAPIPAASAVAGAMMEPQSQ